MAKPKAKAGRKPKGEEHGLAAVPPLTIRMPLDLRAALEATAAAEGRSLTQEIVLRLRNSIRERDRDQQSRALAFLLSETIDVIKGNTVEDWRGNPFAFAALRLAFETILERLQPPGPIEPPAFDPFGGDGPANAHAIILAAETPESLASNVATHVLISLQRGGLHESKDAHSLTAAQKRVTYGMADASRDLMKGRKQ